MYTINVVCCYCKMSLGVKPCTPKMSGKISHGICPACERKVNAEIEKLEADKKKALQRFRK